MISLCVRIFKTLFGKQRSQTYMSSDEESFEVRCFISFWILVFLNMGTLVLAYGSDDIMAKLYGVSIIIAIAIASLAFVFKLFLMIDKDDEFREAFPVNIVHIIALFMSIIPWIYGICVEKQYDFDGRQKYHAYIYPRRNFNEDQHLLAYKYDELIKEEEKENKACKENN